MQYVASIIIAAITTTGTVLVAWLNTRNRRPPSPPGPPETPSRESVDR
jgi:hypothetical protein